MAGTPLILSGPYLGADSKVGVPNLTEKKLRIAVNTNQPLQLRCCDYLNSNWYFLIIYYHLVAERM